jgi:hypothetical protein
MFKPRPASRLSRVIRSSMLSAALAPEPVVLGGSTVRGWRWPTGAWGAPCDGGAMPVVAGPPDAELADEAEPPELDCARAPVAISRAGTARVMIQDVLGRMFGMTALHDASARAKNGALPG